MKRQLSFSLLILFLLAILPMSAEANKTPKEIGGIALGSKIDSYPGITQSNFMKEVVVTDWHGFRKGTISYGVCQFKDEILKIDMKYEDKSKGFYKTLLKKFRQQFGAADSWNGDAFGVVHIWKWKFVDNEQNKVSLALQYNSKNTNETVGNVVRLSYPGKINEERRCFILSCDQKKLQTDTKDSEDLQKTDWAYLIPR